MAQRENLEKTVVKTMADEIGVTYWDLKNISQALEYAEISKIRNEEINEGLMRGIQLTINAKLITLALLLEKASKVTNECYAIHGLSDNAITRKGLKYFELADLGANSLAREHEYDFPDDDIEGLAE